LKGEIPIEYKKFLGESLDIVKGIAETCGDEFYNQFTLEHVAILKSYGVPIPEDVEKFVETL
jgi:hypothetical protein